MFNLPNSLCTSHALEFPPLLFICSQLVKETWGFFFSLEEALDVESISVNRLPKFIPGCVEELKGSQTPSEEEEGRTEGLAWLWIRCQKGIKVPSVLKSVILRE